MSNENIQAAMTNILAGYCNGHDLEYGCAEEMFFALPDDAANTAHRRFLAAFIREWENTEQRHVELRDVLTRLFNSYCEAYGFSFASPIDFWDELIRSDDSPATFAHTVVVNWFCEELEAA